MPIAKQYLQKYLNAQIEQEIASKQFYASCSDKQIGVGLHHTHDAGLDMDRLSQLNASIKMLQTQAPRTYKYKQFAQLQLNSSMSPSQKQNRPKNTQESLRLSKNDSPHVSHVESPRSEMKRTERE